ncbi:hypothetical protein [Leisingera sp.]|uniref:hypothetical protein n=1 Tax=Leisingera sp. TaxID=1879318 RepID=UPI002B26BE85|nr:hypothetical protein [Leisingera sp.]
MQETDFRAISQDYAQGAIRASILINGGAAVALLSQLTNLSTALPKWAVGWAMVAFVAGVSAGALTWLFGFLSTRHVDRTLRGQDLDYSRANAWMVAAEVGVLVAVLLFLIGCLLLAFNFMI